MTEPKNKIGRPFLTGPKKVKRSVTMDPLVWAIVQHRADKLGRGNVSATLEFIILTWAETNKKEEKEQ